MLAAPTTDPCPCGSGTPVQGCCAGGGRRSPALTGERLSAWARERGVEEQLDVAVAELPGGAGRHLTGLPRWFRAGLTVGEVIGVSDLALVDAGKAAAARAAAWEFLLAEVAGVREALEAEAPPPAPEDPALASIAERLRALRAELRSTALPRPPRRLGHVSIRVDLEARRLCVVEHRKLRSVHTQRLVHPIVLLPLAKVREQPLEPPACSCEAPRPCAHALAAVDLALAQLADPRRPAAWAALARALDTPEWARALSALDAACAAHARARSEPAVRFSFRVHALGPARAGVVPFRHRRGPGGTYGAGQRVRPADLAARSPRFPPEDVTALDRLGLLRNPYAFYGSVLELRAGDVAALAGHPRVFLDGAGDAPFSVEPAEVAYAVREVPGGAGELELALSASGAELAPRDLLDALATAGAEASLLHVDAGRRRLVVAKVSEPDLARTLVGALAAHGSRFPREAESALLERVALLQELVQVELPPGLHGEEVPAAKEQVLRLGLRERGLELEALALPLPGAPPQPPGSGPRRLVASGPAGRRFTLRDPEAERAAASELLAALGLPSAEPFRATVADDAAALALVERLRALDRPGVLVEWRGAPPRALRASSAAQLRVRVRDRADWFGLEGEVEIDGERVALALLLEALRERRTVVRLAGGGWLALSAELAQRLAPLARLSTPARDAVEVGPSALGVLDDLARDGATLEATGAFATLREAMRRASRSSPRLPRGFAATLREYQVDGFRWLARLGAWGAGAVLADDMGLGKTLQALALLAHRAAQGPAVVVAPTSVCANWVAEARRFAPSLRVSLFREGDRASAVAALGPGDVLVVSYGLLVLELERFRGRRFATLVLDEAQALKNATTRRARAARDLDAAFKVALSGTPVENHVGELWSLFRIVFPGLLGSWELFRHRFALPIERDHDPAAREALAATVRPFLLRRTKAEVARELPTRTEITLSVALSPDERRRYDEVRLATVARLAGAEGERPERRRFQVLAAITTLRLLACHPRLHDPASALPSAKLARFVQLAAELAEGGHRALVFSQFTSHLALVREALAAAGRSFLYLDGATPPAERDARVARFQAGEGDLFLISLKAGGTGLNLTAADYVVHLDPWWNPAVEDQATDRAHRIGQRRPVTVYRLVSQGTIEEAIVALHARKRELVSGLLGGMDVAGRLSPDELVALIRAGADRGHDDAGELASGSLAGRVAEEEAGEEEDGEEEAAPARGWSADLRHRFRRHLEAELARRRFAGHGPVKSYSRALDRFLDYVASSGVEVRAPARDLPALVPEYVEALRSGRFPAPASEPIVARSALGELTRFLGAA